MDEEDQSEAEEEQSDESGEREAKDQEPPPQVDIAQFSTVRHTVPDSDVEVIIGNSSMAVQDPTLIRRISQMVNRSYGHNRLSEYEVRSRLAMGDSDKPNRVMHLALRNGKLVGCCSSTIQTRWCPLGCGHWGLMVVAVEEQGTGVASRLVEAAEDRLMGEGLGNVQIEYEYSAGDELSERLYEWYEKKLGFECPSGPPGGRGWEWRGCRRKLTKRPPRKVEEPSQPEQEQPPTAEDPSQQQDEAPQTAEAVTPDTTTGKTEVSDSTAPGGKEGAKSAVWEGAASGKYDWDAKAASGGDADKDALGGAITKYSWSDGKKAVSIYIELEGLDDVASDAFESDHHERDLSLSISSVAGRKRTFALSKLFADIDGLKVQQKKGKNMVVLKLQKLEQAPWQQLLQGSAA